MSLSAGRPRVTFGMIVLNGMPFVPYCLRGIYPFAHEIIVVEGASPLARHAAGADGHSTDDTLAAVRRFQAEEDPAGKVKLVTAEDEGHPDGFWPGEKDEQSQAYARRATGNYLWQIDSDEFYRAEDIASVLAMLQADPGITAVSFPQITFWGGFDCCCDSWYLRKGAGVFHRLFKWSEGHRYTTHRPPTVCDAQDNDLRQLKWMNGRSMTRRGIHLYHYSLLFPHQVAQKMRYYANQPWGAYSRGAAEWPRENFMGTISRPFRVHNVHTHPSWLQRFKGEHPAAAAQLRADLAAGMVRTPMRDNHDVEQLLASPTYRALAKIVPWFWPLSVSRYLPRRPLTRLLHAIRFDAERGRLTWRAPAPPIQESLVC
jgi:glycosyltransferase involved in cell wall biosynthesis